jgi:hypothetical protein
VIRGNKPDQKGGCTDNAQRPDKGDFTTNLVAEMTENNAPNGRVRKPTPKVAKAAITPIKGSLSGKNNGANTSPAAVPK